MGAGHILSAQKGAASQQITLAFAGPPMREISGSADTLVTTRKGASRTSTHRMLARRSLAAGHPLATWLAERALRGRRVVLVGVGSLRASAARPLRAGSSSASKSSAWRSNQTNKASRASASGRWPCLIRVRVDGLNSSCRASSRSDICSVSTASSILRPKSRRSTRGPARESS